MFLRKHEGIHGLVLGRGCRTEVNGQICEEGFDLFLTVSKIGSGLHAVENDISFHPFTLGPFGTDRVVPAAHDLGHFMQEF